MKKIALLILVFSVSICAAQQHTITWANNLVIDSNWKSSDSFAVFTNGLSITGKYHDMVTVYKDTTYDRYNDDNFTLRTEYKKGPVDTLYEWNHFAYVCARAKRQHDYWYKVQDVEWKKWQKNNDYHALGEFDRALIKAQYWMGVYDGMRMVLNKWGDEHSFDYEFKTK